MIVAPHLTDTNILLRVSHRNDPDYDLIRSALRSLRASGAMLCYTPQNLAEFWNVCTRPARQNGYGLTVAETNRRPELIERGFTLLPEARGTARSGFEVRSTPSLASRIPSEV